MTLRARTSTCGENAGAVVPEPGPTAVEIRQAVAFGKQAVIRELVDALEAERRAMYDNRFRPPSDEDYERGLLAAIRLVKDHRIEGEPKR